MEGQSGGMELHLLQLCCLPLPGAAERSSGKMTITLGNQWKKDVREKHSSACCCCSQVLSQFRGETGEALIEDQSDSLEPGKGLSPFWEVGKDLRTLSRPVAQSGCTLMEETHMKKSGKKEEKKVIQVKCEGLSQSVHNHKEMAEKIGQQVSCIAHTVCEEVRQGSDTPELADSDKYVIFVNLSGLSPVSAAGSPLLGDGIDDPPTFQAGDLNELLPEHPLGGNAVGPSGTVKGSDASSGSRILCNFCSTLTAIEDQKYGLSLKDKHRVLVQNLKTPIYMLELLLRTAVDHDYAFEESPTAKCGGETTCLSRNPAAKPQHPLKPGEDL
ncbi:hypothetical protein WISP_32110 [Willisornis vidua]|uniref:Uncharacterized protein n=1 Tax=Willisornis vidua TaxID=1566151 RepID=A0ABQ9DP58_9PASS|nr:hypothetical protein WISP_32110 [Willisornis vidua]